MRLPRAWSAILGLLVASCTPSEGLTVDVKTDYAASEQFASVRTELSTTRFRDALVTGTVVTVASSAGENYLAGVRVAEHRGLGPGTYFVRVSLVTASGSVLASRATEVRTQGRYALTAILSRSCEGVVCPIAGDAVRTECNGGVCVDPRCSPETPETCAAGCSAASDCTTDPRARTECGSASCVDGVCLFAPTDARCAAGARCRGTDLTCGPPIDAASSDAGARDAGPPEDTRTVPDSATPEDAYEPPLDCLSYQDCAPCPGGGGWCVRGACAPTNPTTVERDFDTPSGQLFAGVGDGWTFVAGSAHTGSTSLVSEAGPGLIVRSRTDVFYEVAHPASLTFWVETNFWGSDDVFTAQTSLYPPGSHGGTTGGWVQYDVPLPAGRGYVSLEHRGDPGPEVRTARLDDFAIGPPLSPSTDFESGSIPAGYVSASPTWHVETCPGGRSGQCARSGALGSNQRSVLMRMVQLAADDTLSFWLRTSTESRDRLWTYVDGEPSGSPFSGETAWRLHTIPLTAGGHTITWAYEKDASMIAGSDAVWIDDVSFGTFTPYDGPLCP